MKQVTKLSEDCANKLVKVLYAALALCLILLGQITIGRWHSETTYHEIYCATLPFGFIYLDGSVSGSFVFGFGGISGEIGLGETYNIKYMEGNELITLTFDAEEMPLIVDGLFQVEKTIYWRTYYSLLWKQTEEASEHTEYQIHIPYLPELNQTLTETWIK